LVRPKTDEALCNFPPLGSGVIFVIGEDTQDELYSVSRCLTAESGGIFGQLGQNGAALGGTVARASFEG